MREHPDFIAIEKAIGQQILIKPARGRGMRLYVRNSAVILSVPKQMDATHAMQFVRGQIPWLRKHLQKQEVGSALGIDAIQLDFAATDRVPIFAEAHAIDYVQSGAPFLCLSRAALPETIAQHSMDDSPRLQLLAHDRKSAKRQLINALGSIHLRALQQDVKTVSGVLQVSPRRVTVKPMRTLWGSLQPNNAMSVNFALIFAPRACTHYIVAHELAHVLERNHSSRFWAQVKRAFPNYQSVHDYLRIHHSYLMALQERVFATN